MKLTLRTKLLLAFATILTLMVFMGAVIMAQLFAINQIAEDAYVHGQASIKLTGDTIAETLRIRERLVSLANATLQDERIRQLNEIDKHTAQVFANMQRYEPLIESDGARQAVNDFYAAWDDFIAASGDLTQVALDGRSSEARLILTGQADPALENVINLLLLIQDIEDNQHRVEFFEGLAISQRVVLVAVGVTGAAIVLGLVLALWLSKNIAVPMSTMAESAQAVSQGDLDQTLPADTLHRSDEVGVLANAFVSMTDQLRELVGSLEQRVASRTERLELVAVLSERLNAILDFDTLLQELVDDVKESFHYYHAHVYIFDENRQNLVMTAGAGDIGAQMKSEGHSIAYNAPSSLVARAARTGNIVNVNNVRETEGWLPNPLLPDTYAEMAVPIILGEQVVGVLDVQQNRIGGLDEGDANLLRSLANQVAIAIRNARQFAQVETALANAQAIQEQYVTQSWDQSRIANKNAEYRYIQTGAASIDDALGTRLEKEAARNNQPALIPINGNGELSGSSVEEKEMALVAPIKLQNQTIGVLHFEEEGQQWGEDELDLVSAIADQVAQIAEGLRLFEQTRQRAGREQTIREITEKMRAATNLEELVQTTAKELSQRFHSERALIDLGINDSAELSEQLEDQQT